MTDRRDFVKMSGVLAFGGLLGAAGEVAAGPPAVHLDVMDLVDPALRPAALQMQEQMKGFASYSARDLPKIRAMFASAAPAARDDVSIDTRRVPSRKGQPDVQIYVVNAHPSGARPGILHTHGGGFILGEAKSALRSLQDIAESLDCTIVTVDYRLAPETRFEGSIEDNYAGLTWLYNNAAALGVDPKRLAVMGESAGGGHAALLAIAARDRGEVPLIFQVLIYPMLDDRTGSSRPVPSHIGTLGWTVESNRFGWGAFLGQAPGRVRAPAGAVPARIGELHGLPPAFIGVGALDLFVEEDLEYARRLVAAGVQTEFHLVPGAFHGFDGVEAASVAKRFNAQKLDAMRRAFGSPPRA
jgi:acetyl esterase/lipase